MSIEILPEGVKTVEGAGTVGGLERQSVGADVETVALPAESHGRTNHVETYGTGAGQVAPQSLERRAELGQGRIQRLERWIDAACQSTTEVDLPVQGLAGVGRRS